MGFMPVLVPETTQQAMKTQLKAWVGPGYSISIRPSKGDFAHRLHDRNAPGFNHMAFYAEDRSDIDAMYNLLKEIGAQDEVRIEVEDPSIQSFVEMLLLSHNRRFYVAFPVYASVASSVAFPSAKDSTAFTCRLYLGEVHNPGFKQYLKLERSSAG